MSFELKATHLLSYSTGSRQGTYHINWQDRWLPDVPEQRLHRHRNHLGQIFGDECTHTKWRGLREYVNQLLLTFFIPLNLSRLSNLYRSSSKRSWMDRNWRRTSPNQFKINCYELIFPQPGSSHSTHDIFIPMLCTGFLILYRNVAICVYRYLNQVKQSKRFSCIINS